MVAAAETDWELAKEEQQPGDFPGLSLLLLGVTYFEYQQAVAIAIEVISERGDLAVNTANVDLAALSPGSPTHGKRVLLSR